MDERKYKIKTDFNELMDLAIAKDELISDFRAGRADDRIIDLLEMLDDISNDLFMLKTKENKLYETQDKLIGLLEKADDMYDRLQWKLFWEKKDEIVEEIMKKRKND